MKAFDGGEEHEQDLMVGALDIPAACGVVERDRPTDDKILRVERCG